MSWCVKPSGKNNYFMTGDITWGGIKACATHLSINCKKWGGEGEEFAPLHRVEGGFMCVAGPGFQTTEVVDSKLDNQSLVGGDGVEVRKAIRFDAGMYGSWPSRDNSFLDTPNLHDETVVIPMGKNGMFTLRFEGKNCKKWTPSQCEEFGRIIAEEVQAFAIHGNLAAKVRNGADRKGIAKRAHTRS